MNTMTTTPKPCRVKLTGGTIKFVHAHHRTVQAAVRAAERAGVASVTVAGTVLQVADISIVLPARKRRGEPTAPPYRPYYQRENQ